MAQLCLGLATSHLAHIVNARNLGDPKQVAVFDAGYRRLADALANAKPDVSLIISADHVNKFFIDNMPAFGIGMFDAFSGPIESKTRNFGVPYRNVPSDLGFSRYLVERGLDEGVDWAVTESWEVDHGFMVPLFRLDPGGAISDGPDLHQLRGAPAAEPEALLRRRPLARRRDRPLGQPTSASRSSPPEACPIPSARCSRAGSTRISITASSATSAPGAARRWRLCPTAKSPRPDRRQARSGAGSCSPARSPAAPPSR